MKIHSLHTSRTSRGQGKDTELDTETCGMSAGYGKDAGSDAKTKGVLMVTKAVAL